LSYDEIRGETDLVFLAEPEPMLVEHRKRIDPALWLENTALRAGACSMTPSPARIGRHG
jgi:hypothetical protein